jgi:hypothetical protein
LWIKGIIVVLLVQVLCLRHRGAGKLPIPVSALPSSLTTLALKKVLLHRQHSICAGTSSSSSSSSISISAVPGYTPQQQQQQQQQLVVQLDVSELQAEHEQQQHSVGCHAITSPGFRRAAAYGLSSRPPSPTEGVVGCNSKQTALTGSSAANAAVTKHPAASSSSSSSAVLLNLKSLFMKNCLVGGETLQLLLGLSAAAASSSSSGSSSSGCSQLVRLSVTGDQAGHGEVAEAWPEWVAAIGQLTGLQVRAG